MIGRLTWIIFLLTTVAKAQAPNDDPCAATVLPVNGNCVFSSSTTMGATATTGVGAPACGTYSGGDVWFSATVPASGNLIIDTQMDEVDDAAMEVYTGTCSSLTAIGCDMNSSMSGAGSMGGGTMPMLSFTGLAPGTTVWIRVWAETGATNGTFGICANDNNPPDCSPSPPAGDICENATYMCTLDGYCSSTSAAYSFINSSGGDENDYLSWISAGPFCGTIENNSWLSFTAGATDIVLNVWSFNCANNWGIQMQIYQTADCFNFTPVSDCWFPGTATSGIVTATGLTPGQLYYLMIDGADGDVCDYVIQPGEGVFVGIDAGPDTTIACGQSIQLHATGATDIYWQADSTLSSTTIPDPIASPSMTTIYYAYSNLPGCDGNQAVDSVTVTVSNGMALNYSVIASSCFSPTGQASVMVLGGTPPFDYEWLPGGASTAAITGVAPGHYTVEVNDAGGCSGILDIDIPADSTQLAIDLGEDTLACEQDFLLVLDAGISGCLYHWSNGATTQAISVFTTGTFWVQVNSLYCTDADTIQVTQVQWPTISQTYSCEKMSTSLCLESFAGQVYQWSTGEESNCILVSDPGIYQVLVAQGSCQVTDTAVVGERENFSALYLPNTFTPNADGTNDAFRPTGEGIADYNLRIYNRWGEKIFESKKMEEGWDGTFRGKLVQDGVYVWVLDFVSSCSGIVHQQKTGHVCLIR